jgi:hypothetical protein
VLVGFRPSTGIELPVLGLTIPPILLVLATDVIE